MIRILALLGALTLVTAHATAQTTQTEPPFEPSFPNSSSVGNAIVASAEGFESLYANPAGFARGKPSFTIATVAPGLDLVPTGPNLERLSSAWDSPSNAGDTLAPLFAANGFGGSVAAGLGYSGSGLGLGLLLDGRSWGSSSSDMSANATIAFIGGMGFNVGKHLVLGGAVRPMLRVNVPVLSADELFSFLHQPATAASSVLSLYGFGVALDFGAIADYGALSYGLTVSDIGNTRLYYAQDSLSGLISSIGSGNGLPTGQPVADSYMIPMQATFGIAYHPAVGKRGRLFDPRIELDYVYRFDPGQMLRAPTTTELLDGIRAGADLRLFSFFHLRMGYEYGRVRGGVGIQFPGFQMDAMVFQQVAPSGFAGSTSGILAGVSIRF